MLLCVSICLSIKSKSKTSHFPALKGLIMFNYVYNGYDAESWKDHVRYDRTIYLFWKINIAQHFVRERPDFERLEVKVKSTSHTGTRAYTNGRSLCGSVVRVSRSYKSSAEIELLFTNMN